MAWELTIQHPNGHRLGSPKEVQAKISRVWPQLEWHVQEAAPKTVGVLDTESVSFELYGLDDDPVEDFYIDVRGDGDPTPLLLQLKKQGGLTIKELATQRILDDRQLQERWENYRQLRDGAKARQSGSSAKP
jgi:hypothetical protein